MTSKEAKTLFEKVACAEVLAYAGVTGEAMLNALWAIERDLMPYLRKE